MAEKYRLRFTKINKSKYISHLDLMSTMQRALIRSGVNLKYSQGFNPHPHLSAALPLPIGSGSICELLDFKTSSDIKTDIDPELISKLLPDGITVTDLYEPQSKFNEIAWVSLSAVWYYDREISDDAPEMLENRFGETGIIISKKTKRGESNIDISLHLRDAKFMLDPERKNELQVSITVSAQNPTINADNIIAAIGKDLSFLKPDFALFTRTELYNKEMIVFK